MELTQRDLLNVLRYDADAGTLHWRRGTRGYAVIGSRAVTCIDLAGYVIVNVNGKRLKAHRVIWCMEYGTWPIGVDHINHVRHDNRLSNLREVSQQQNSRNMSKTVGRSLPNNVDYRKSRGMYAARLNTPDGQKHLGYFDSVEGALSAVVAAKARLGFHPNHGK